MVAFRVEQTPVLPDLIHVSYEKNGERSSLYLPWDGPPLNAGDTLVLSLLGDVA